MDEGCIRRLLHKHIGYADVEKLEILTHLCDTYSRVTSNYLKKNDKHLPFENLIDQVKDAVDYTSVGKSPYTPKNAISTYNIINEPSAHSKN